MGLVYGGLSQCGAEQGTTFLIGLGKYTPVVALQGDMGWEPSTVKQWVCIGRSMGKND